MSIIEAANGTFRTYRDEEGSNGWEQTAVKLNKNSRFHCCTHMGPESAGKEQIFSVKLSKLAPFPLNMSDYATAWMGGTTSMHTEIISWTLGSLPSCTMELKFASDAINNKCQLWLWNRKDRYDSFLPLTNILKSVILEKLCFFQSMVQIID